MRRVLLALLLYACSAPPPAGEAFVQVTVTAQTASAQITLVTVTVVPAGIDRNLDPGAGGTFTGRLSVPAGLQTVTATAWAGTTLAGSGSGSVTVIKGSTVQLSIAAWDVTGAPPTPDHSPVITALSASATTVEVGDPVSLAATALDVDAGDAVTFSWTATPAGCGSFTAPAAPSTLWTAAAPGTCLIAVRASARNLGDTKSVSIVVTPVVDVPTPMMVQHLSSTMNPPTDGTFGNDYKFTLPNPVIAGNCLILGISYPRSPGRTVSVTDNLNLWPQSPAISASDPTNLTSSIFVLPNARAGVTAITVRFDAPVNTFQYTVSEFNDIALVSPVSGVSGGLSNAPNLSVPAFTPANNDQNGGNLIWSYFIDDEFVTDNATGTFAAAAPFTLLDADIGWTELGLPHASQYFVQTTAGPVTPAMTATMAPGNDGYNGVAVALRAASAGSPAPASGIRVQRISHFTSSTPPTTWNFQFPTKGNLIVGVVCQSDIIDITSITDSRGNVYKRFEPETDEPQIFYAVNATPDPNLKITVHSVGTPVNSSFLWYDISGAAPSPPDAFGDESGLGIRFGNDRIDDAPVITPLSPGLTIAAISFGTGPATGLASGSPADAIFDYVKYTGEIDIDRMDNADGRAHLYNTDLSAEHFNWILNHTMGTTASATAVHFKAAPP